MTISQVSSYAPSNNDPTNLMQTTDDMRVGLHELTITEYTTSTVPAIAAGSVIEVNGTLFKAGSATAISGSPSNGTVYVYMVPSGSSPSQVLTPTFTNTTPTWFDSKQGWYDATGTYRYINYAMTKSGSSYTPKWELILKNDYNVKFGSTGIVTAAGFIGYATKTWDTTAGTALLIRYYDVTITTGNYATSVATSSLTSYVALIGQAYVSGPGNGIMVYTTSTSVIVKTIDDGNVASNLVTRVYYFASA